MSLNDRVDHQSSAEYLSIPSRPGSKRTSQIRNAKSSRTARTSNSNNRPLSETHKMTLRTLAAVFALVFLVLHMAPASLATVVSDVRLPYISIPARINSTAAAMEYLDTEYAKLGFFRNRTAAQPKTLQPNQVGPCEMCQRGQNWRQNWRGRDPDGYVGTLNGSFRRRLTFSLVWPNRKMLGPRLDAGKLSQPFS
jgi:hypothetical protein